MTPHDADLDRQLRQLMKEACKFPPGSRERRKLLNHLIYKMQQSGAIAKNGDDCYEEALQQTWIWFSKSFCNFNPEQEGASVIGWFKTTLRRRRIDLYRKEKRERDRRYIPPFNPDEERPDPIEQIVDPCQSPQAVLQQRILLETIKNWIEQQSNLLRRKHVSDRPDINCKDLILYRIPSEDRNLKNLVEGKTWKELAEIFGVPERQLRQCYNQKCLPCLRKFLESEGYPKP